MQRAVGASADLERASGVQTIESSPNPWVLVVSQEWFGVGLTAEEISMFLSPCDCFFF